MADQDGEQRQMKWRLEWSAEKGKMPDQDGRQRQEKWQITIVERDRRNARAGWLTEKTEMLAQVGCRDRKNDR